MSDQNVRVNLLPREVSQKAAAGRARALVALVLVGLLGVVGAAWFWFGQQLDDKRTELASEEEVLAALRADLADLDEYAALRAEVDASGDILRVALGNDASLAGVLQDFAAILPSDVEITSFNVTLDPDGTVLSIGDERPAYGTISISGMSLNGHAPGLERLLIELDKVAAFSDVHFSNSTRTDQEGIAAEVIDFSVEIDLGPETYTGRYDDGVPEGLR